MKIEFNERFIINTKEINNENRGANKTYKRNDGREKNI